MRERKRLERSDHIVDAATELFRSKGYESTTMEEIAERADVSPPTLYRYFPTKVALLIAFLWKARERRADMLDDYFEKSAALDPVAAISGLLLLNNRSVGSRKDRKLWRESMGALLRNHDQAYDEFRLIKQEFENRIENMLLQLRSLSLISDDTPIQPMVNVLYAVANENFNRMIANEFKTLEDEKRAMDEQVALVMKAWLSGVRR
jgi:AcrR family transcriptional regulator